MNRASHQFDGTDYTKYQRMLHVRWQGDVGPIPEAAFPLAEGMADEAGVRLISLLNQLHDANVSVDVIAHSLGNRVALRALNECAEAGKGVLVNHLFLWDAAVPNNSLSNDINTDFPSATQAAKKITVLFSQNDATLAGWYHRDKVAAHLYHDFVTSSPTLKIIAPKLVEQYQHTSTYEDVPLALGFNGPDMHDKFVRDMWTNGKLTLADMTPWSTGHSYMRVPSDNVMKHGFQTWVLNKNARAMNAFGVYDADKFPDYPAYTVKPDGTVVYVKEEGKQ